MGGCGMKQYYIGGCGTNIGGCGTMQYNYRVPNRPKFHSESSPMYTVEERTFLYS